MDLIKILIPHLHGCRSLNLLTVKIRAMATEKVGSVDFNTFGRCVVFVFELSLSLTLYKVKTFLPGSW